MKFQLYAVPEFSGAASTLRKMDGVWTAIGESTMQKTDYINDPGVPCNQAQAESRVKCPILINRVMARFYGIPDDAELYDCLEDNKCK